jgi:uncharacterized membrane protein
MSDVYPGERMLKTEESKVAMAVLISFGLLLVTLVQTMWAMAEAVIVMIAVVLFAVFAVNIMKKPREKRDERSERCSFMATRNGFVVAVIGIAAYSVFALETTLSSHSIIDLMSAIWGAIIITYMLSYFYYQGAYERLFARVAEVCHVQ